MDDSERSYGYSKDIYHGRQGVGGHYEPGHSEKSYEYEGGGDAASEGELSAEEAAMHVIDSEERPVESPEEAPVGASDSGGRSTSNRVESFTWENEGTGVPSPK